MIIYLDTSAAMKLFVEEVESAALSRYVASMDDSPDVYLAASWLLHTELHRAAQRHPDAVDAASVATLLGAVSLVDITRGDLLTAGSLPGRLRSHDAIHLAVALRIGADTVLAYDAELLEAANGAGLATESPRSIKRATRSRPPHD